MGIKTYAKLFSYNVICQVCRKKIKVEESFKRWDGLIVCSQDMEERHPLDMPRPPLKGPVPISPTSPEPADTFSNSCSTNTSVADAAVAECMIADVDNDLRYLQGTFGSYL